jgi:hypothetical protein
MTVMKRALIRRVRRILWIRRIRRVRRVICFTCLCNVTGFLQRALTYLFFFVLAYLFGSVRVKSI